MAHVVEILPLGIEEHVIATESMTSLISTPGIDLFLLEYSGLNKKAK